MRDVVGEGAAAAGGIAGGWLLDLDALGTQVSQELGAVGRAHQLPYSSRRTP